MARLGVESLGHISHCNPTYPNWLGPKNYDAGASQTYNQDSPIEYGRPEGCLDGCKWHKGRSCGRPRKDWEAHFRDWKSYQDVRSEGPTCFLHEIKESKVIRRH